MTGSLDHERLAVLVHEVRSPVAALAAISETFADAGSDAPARAELARLALTACQGIARVVTDAVSASVQLEPVEPGALVLDVATTTSLGGARIEARVEPDLPLVLGDPVRLRQALSNLVTNALVHSGADEPIVVGARGEQGDVVLFVSDTGVGIPAGDQERIFVAGERLDPTRPGAGIGLALVGAIAEAHGARLAVSSSPGEGATFTIALPAHHPATRAPSS